MKEATGELNMTVVTAMANCDDGLDACTYVDEDGATQTVDCTNYFSENGAGGSGTGGNAAG